MRKKTTKANAPLRVVQKPNDKRIVNLVFYKENDTKTMIYLFKKANAANNPFFSHNDVNPLNEDMLHKSKGFFFIEVSQGKKRELFMFKRTKTTKDISEVYEILLNLEDSRYVTCWPLIEKYLLITPH